MNPADIDDICDICYHQHPALIYIAIGCAQAHHPPEYRTPQQFPPFIRDNWPTGSIVAVLIDPALESDEELTPVPDDTVTIIPIRTEYDWAHPDLLRRLCEMLMSTHIYTRLILQDYTGIPYSHRLNPLLREFGRNLAARALFDVQYGQGDGCFVDFSTVHILRDPGTGYFIQPQYMTLADAVENEVPMDHIHRVATARIFALRRASDELAAIAITYGLEPTAARSTLLTRFLTDLAAIAEVTIPIAELVTNDNTDQLTSTMFILRDIALGPPC